MCEIDRVKQFLKSDPLRRVEESGCSSLEELFQLFLPGILPEKEKHLLTEFFVYKYTGKSVAEGDEDRFSDLERIDAVMGGVFLPSIVSKLKKIDEYMRSYADVSGYALTSEEFWQLLSDMLDDHVVRLDVKDLKILDAMSRGVLKKREIGKQTGIEYRTVFNRIKRLEARCGLRVVSLADYARMGLTHMVVLVEGEADFESVYPFSRYELGFGEFTLFSIGVPPRRIREVMGDFESRFSRTWFWSVDRFESVSSFGNYDTDTGEWSVDWNAWSLYLDNVLSRGWDAAIPPEAEGGGSLPSYGTEREERESVTVDDLSFISVLLEDFDMSSEELGERCGCSASKAAMVKNKLLRMGIIRPYFRVERIGLSERILFIVESDVDTLYSFVAAIKELPRALIYWTEPLVPGMGSEGSPALACWLETPPGSFFPFERVVRLRLRPLAEYMLFLYRPVTTSESAALASEEFKSIFSNRVAAGDADGR
ncbi:MAG: hypothetical protein Q6352_015240 [Candidatus Freyrarchaeum guaymaensis]